MLLFSVGLAVEELEGLSCFRSSMAEKQNPEPVRPRMTCHLPDFPCMHVCVILIYSTCPSLKKRLLFPSNFAQPESSRVGFMRSEENSERVNFSIFLRSPALRKSNQIPRSGARETIPTGYEGKPGSGPSPTRSNPFEKQGKITETQKEWVPVPVPDEQSEAVGFNDKGSNTRFPSSSRVHHGSKRTRKPKVHSLSEKRRRDKFNKKIRALQELIPNCNKADKVSVLDDAIEYLKKLQFQVQMMSMGSSGVYMPPMMLLAPSMQHIHAQVPLGGFSPMAVGGAMQMGLGWASLLPGINLARLNMLGLPGQVLLTSMSPLPARFPQLRVPTPAGTAAVTLSTPMDSNRTH